jgi:hypothetical protein
VNVRIATRNGPINEPAYSSGARGLCITKGFAKRAHLWVVTHEQSGMAVGGRKTGRGARNLAKLLSAMGIDWTQEPAEIKRQALEMGLLRKIEKIRWPKEGAK